MRQVFISYRRADAGELADEIAVAIRSVFGRESVFIDTADIPAGSPWTEVLDQRLEGMAALVCVIGRDWIGAAARRGRAGRRQLDDPNDWLRREIRGAIDRRIPILPVVADRAHIPVASQLPAEIRTMLDVQALRISPSSDGSPTLIDWLADRLVPPIRFAEPLLIDPRSLVDVCGAFWDRVDQVSLTIRPKSDDEVRAQIESDNRACLVRQPVLWHPDLVAAIRRPEVPDRVRESAMRLLRSAERRFTSTWVGLVRYAGPPSPGGTTTRAAVHLLCFAALRILHTLSYYTGETQSIRPPLKDVPRWELDIDRFFNAKEDIGNAYVTRVSGLDTMPDWELCIYGPRSLAEQSYRDSNFGLLGDMSTSWYGEYFVPQLELLLAASERREIVRYDGRVAIRKVVDLNGDDLPLRS
jgi:hypothetical protein